MAEFIPSDVAPFFPNSAFRKTEKEIMAAQLVAFLAGNGDRWDTVIEFGAFAEHTKTAELTPIYRNPFSNPIIGQDCVNAFWALMDDGYLEVIEERRRFKVTAKLIEFYGPYVKA